MPVQINAVNQSGLGIRRGLAGVFDNLARHASGKRPARYRRYIKIRVPRSRYGKLKFIYQAFGRTHPSQTGSKLNKKFGAVSVTAFGNVPPAGETRARSVDARKIGKVIELRYRGIHAVADRHQAGSDKPDTAFRPFGKVLNHFRVGASRFFRHADIAHRPHDQTIFYFYAVYL